MNGTAFSSQLRVRQDGFLALFGTRRGADSDTAMEIALRDALSSSLKRNRTYASGASHDERSALHQSWRSELVRIASSYCSPRSLAQYEQDVISLVKLIRSSHGGVLCSGPSGSAWGFRVAHAQKSLSLVLKHLWCHGLIVEPPACPVDFTILKKAGAPASLRNWTSLDSLSDYQARVKVLQIAANAAGRSLAVWELFAFKQNGFISPAPAVRR